MDPSLVQNPNESPRPGIAHVLFMDIVKYGKLKMREQLGVYSQLKDIVRNTDEYRCKGGSDSLVCRPVGDGMAVVFFADPSAPVRCAIEIDRHIKRQQFIQLRMGIHSGPVFRLTDINEQPDVAGEGINIAQRVMDSGDANHILLSRAMADILIAMGDWNDYIREIGPVEIKHGAQIFLYNFSSKDVGNPSVPTSAAKWKPDPPSWNPSSSNHQRSRDVGIEAIPGASEPSKSSPPTQFLDCLRCGMLIPPLSATCIHCGARNV
jgi:class 3 adenylate cyclase